MAPRRVVIVPDVGRSRLHYIRCEKPCGRDGDRWCQRDGLPPGAPGICWMGSSLTREGAVQLAECVGYEVVEP